MDLFLGLLFGAVGTVYAVYGRKSHDPTFLIVGFLLMLYPYLFSNAILIFLIGLALSAFPIARRKGLI